jgi:hypothetical protein
MREWYSVLRTIAACFAGIAALSCACVFTTAAALAEQPFMTLDKKLGDAVAWWVAAEFHPFTTEVRGIPAGKIRKSWCKATELRKDLLPRDVVFDEDGKDTMEEFSFALEGNFDSSAAKQVALVGVYEDCAGKTGHFFMILAPSAAGQPKVLFLDTAQDVHPFSALSMDKDKTIYVWSCMECDNVAKLKWDRKKRKFVWLPAPED